MKIVFLQDDFPPESFGGAGISTYELAKGMQKAGHEVSVITTCRKAMDAGEVVYDGLKVFKVASRYPARWRAWLSVWNPRVVREVGKILAALDPDVVHANNLHAYISWASLKMAKRYARMVVWTARDTMAISYGKLVTERYREHFDARVTWLDNFRHARKRYNPLRNFLIKRCLWYADKKLAVSEELARALEQNGITPVAAVHTGTDARAWQADPQEVVQFKRKHGLEGKKVVLFGGRLSAQKGGEKAIEAVALLARQEPRAVLLVAGQVDAYAEEMRAKAAKVGANLALTGWVAGGELCAAYAAADVVLVPSLYLDPFPRIVLEAMAAGKPVVATRYGGAPEAVVDGATGYIVDPRQPEEVAEKLLDLLQNPLRAKAFGRAGLERITAELSLERMVLAYLAQYQTLAKV